MAWTRRDREALNPSQSNILQKHDKTNFLHVYQSSICIPLEITHNALTAPISDFTSCHFSARILWYREQLLDSPSNSAAPGTVHDLKIPSRETTPQPCCYFEYPRQFLSRPPWRSPIISPGPSACRRLFETRLRNNLESTAIRAKHLGLRK